MSTIKLCALSAVKALNVTVFFVGLCLAGSLVQAATDSPTKVICSATIHADDAYHFTPEHLEIPASCRDFTVTLKHVGRLPKAAMGHNWVLTSTTDAPRVARDGLIAGLDNNFVTPGDKRVIAFTRVIGGDDSATVTFSTLALKPGERYAFQCTFGGHSALMQGSLRINDAK